MQPRQNKFTARGIQSSNHAVREALGSSHRITSMSAESGYKIHPEMHCEEPVDTPRYSTKHIENFHPHFIRPPFLFDTAISHESRR